MDEAVSRKYPVREDMRFQRRSWALERVGWAVLALIAIAGLTGALGNGPASRAQASAGPLSVSYERFQRATRTSAFVFEVTHQADTDMTLHLGKPFQPAFEITSIQPPPLRGRTGPDGIDLTFSADGGGKSQVVIWARSHILEAARKLQGLERIDQIKFAILEATGVITIVPAVQAGRIEPAAAPASL